MTPRVSVIVPVRDRRELLRATLDALHAQTVAEHEVIVVDDGSTDGSGDEAEKDARAGRPVRCIRLQGVGAVRARQRGVAEASAAHLAFTDSDCQPVPGWLAAGLDALEAGADLVVGPTRPLRRPGPFERTVWVERDDGLYATCNAFYRREAFEQAGGFELAAGRRLGFRPGRTLRDLGFGEDTLLGWRVRRTGTVAFADRAEVHHHVFDASVVDAVGRAWNCGGFAALVAEVPELRDTFLRQRWFLGSRRRVALPLALLALTCRRGHLAAGLTAAWVAGNAGELRRQVDHPASIVGLLPTALAIDATRAAGLLAGSIRARSLVL